jgi:hypothetical protein
MSTSDFYSEPSDPLCQGDIFATIPHIFLKERPNQIALMMAGKRAGFLVDEFRNTDAPPQCSNEIVVPAQTRVGYAILISHSCELDKPPPHRVIALVRQVSELSKEEEKETIRNNGKYACFYLPSIEDKLPESYVDFRRISTIGPKWLLTTTRQASLTDHARKKMLLALIRFFARLELKQDVFSNGELAE